MHDALPLHRWLLRTTSAVSWALGTQHPGFTASPLEQGVASSFMIGLFWEETTSVPVPEHSLESLLSLLHGQKD